MYIAVFYIGSIPGGSLTYACLPVRKLSAYVYTSIQLRNCSGHALATGKVGKMLLAMAVDCLWLYSCRLFI